MSMNSKCFRLATTAALLFGFAALCGQAQAIPVGTGFFKKAQKKAGKNQASGQELHEALQILHHVNHTLKHADHDYGGHRVHAVKAIGQAEHQLDLIVEHHHKHHKTKHPHAGQKGKGQPEPQKLSDAQLAQSIPALHAAANFISHANHDFGGHRTKALKDIHHAVTQLQEALKYSAAHNAGKK